MPKVRVTPIIGLPQFDGWSQVIESPVHSSVKTVVSLAIEGSHAGNVGRDIANYYSSQVTQTLEEFHSLLEELITQAKENDTQILCSAGFFSGDHCAFATFNGAVLLKRERKIGTILSSAGELKLITGRVSLQDVVVFSTLPSANFFSEMELKFEQGYDVDTIVTSVVPGLHAEENSSLSALAVVTFSESAKEKAQVVGTTSSRTVLSSQTEPSQNSGRSVSQDMPGRVDKKSQNVQNSTEKSLQMPADLTDSLEEPLKNSSLAKKRNATVFLNSFFSKVLTLLSFLFHHLRQGFKSFLPRVQALWNWLHSVLRVLIKKGSNIVKKNDTSVNNSHVTSNAKRLSLKAFFPSKDIYIETSDRKRMKTVKLAAIAVSVVLVVGTGGAAYVSKRNAEVTAANAAIEPLRVRANEAEQLLESDPVAARNQMNAVLREVEDLQSQQSERSLFYTVVSEERERIAQKYEEISGLDELQELPLFYDLRLVSSDFIASKVQMQDDTLFFFDTEKKTLVTLEIGSKKANKYNIDLPAVRDVALFDSNPLVLTPQGINAVLLSDQEATVAEVIAEGDSNRAADLLEKYQSYLYVVNPEKRNIYRYSYSDSDEAFSDPIGWVQEIARGLDFTTVSSIAIDGDVWLGTKTGEVYQFTRGQVQDFSVRGMQNAFSSTIYIHTNEELEYLYILEPQKNRVVILQKNGDFIKEIQNTSLGSVTDIAIDPSGSKIYAVSGSVVFELVVK